MRHFALIFCLLLASCGCASGQSSRACPIISFVDTERLLAPGTTNDFRVTISPIETPEKLSYVWGTSLGKIVSGFGTPAIKLLLSEGDAYRTVTAFVRVDGLADTCVNAVSHTFHVAPTIPDESFILTFGLVGRQEMRAHIDQLFVMSNSFPTAQPIIIMRFAANERDGTRLQRLRRILHALRFRNLTSKVSLAIVETPSRTESAVGLVPYNVEFDLKNEQFVLIKAEELDRNPRKILGTKVCNCYRKIK